MAAAELQRREVMMAESEGLIHELRAQVAQQASQPQQWTPSRRSATSTASPGWPGTAADSAALDVREAAEVTRNTFSAHKHTKKAPRQLATFFFREFCG